MLFGGMLELRGDFETHANRGPHMRSDVLALRRKGLYERWHCLAGKAPEALAATFAATGAATVHQDVASSRGLKRL